MRWVVFLRAANVGKHNRFRPGDFAKELARFGVINIGAVGTFVVCAKVTEKSLRAAILAKLPFECEVMICREKEIVDLVRGNPLKNEATDNDRRIFLTVMSKRLARLPNLPIYAPKIDKWEVKVAQISGALVLTLWRRLKPNPLYPNQVIEKIFGVAATTRSWTTIEKVAAVLNSQTLVRR